jgi:DNA mismatch endonuclease (patch repair protein)
MDSVSSQVRSRVMATVQSRRNRSTEWRVRAALIRAGIKGWKLNAGDILGKPDFVFPVERVAVFVDGCFWHGCSRCNRVPNSNVAYWKPKIQRNKTRDRATGRNLRRQGWRVIRVWEHQLKSTEYVLNRIRTCL